jgi:hypothetical protein
VSEPSELRPETVADAILLPPDMPSVDLNTLSRYPTLFLDSSGLRHTLGWQRSAGFDDRACLPSAGSRTCLESRSSSASRSQAGWADASADLLCRDSGSARTVLDILTRVSPTGWYLGGLGNPAAGPAEQPATTAAARTATALPTIGRPPAHSMDSASGRNSVAGTPMSAES